MMNTKDGHTMIEKTPHMSLEVCKEVIHNVSQFPLHKAILAGFFCTYAHVLGNGQVFIPVTFLAILDASTGVMRSLKLGTFTWSHGFKRSGQKFLVYLIMILTAGVVDVEFPGNYGVLGMKSFLVGTEAISILENIGQMGWPVPQKLLQILKIQRDVPNKNKETENN